MSIRAVRARMFPAGTRVRAVWFALDEGLRIWPIQAFDDGAERLAAGRARRQQLWRVVRVADQRVRDELARDELHKVQAAYPDAIPEINHNESVPPGTEGTVRDVDGFGTIFVDWDNGHIIGVTTRDRIVKVQ